MLGIIFHIFLISLISFVSYKLLNHFLSLDKEKVFSVIGIIFIVVYVLIMIFSLFSEDKSFMEKEIIETKDLSIIKGNIYVQVQENGNIFYKENDSLKNDTYNIDICESSEKKIEYYKLIGYKDKFLDLLLFNYNKFNEFEAIYISKENIEYIIN